MGCMSQYIFVTFAPVQSFVERTRKLRDLYGASIILSYLSREIAKAAKRDKCKIISPGLSGYTKGMPNRILLYGNFSQDNAKDALDRAWEQLLDACQCWLEEWLDNTLSQDTDFSWVQRIQTNKGKQYSWDREWRKWKQHAWELFWGSGATPNLARENLETHKLSRRWIAINWIGESSSLSGIDAIAYPRLESPDIDPKNWTNEECLATAFFQKLSERCDQLSYQSQTEEREIPESEKGKFMAPNELLSVPELVKRLVTSKDIINSPNSPNSIGIKVPKSFSDMVRRTSDLNNAEELSGHWTGWFMGDGDRFGHHLSTLSQSQQDSDRSDANSEIENQLESFSRIVRLWGRETERKFPKNLGRIVFAGGDDFLGAIYSTNPQSPIPGSSALQYLQNLHSTWIDKVQNKLQKENLPLEHSVTVSAGFVWVGAGVPQRDVLQHCREAEKRSKNLGRDRITLRIVFNNGQFIEWTAPWEYLKIFESYRDLDGKQGNDANWSHIYRDLGYLKSRHAFGLGVNFEYLKTFKKYGCEDWKAATLNFFELYFPATNTIDWRQKIENETSNRLFPDSQCRDQRTIVWIENLILVGWHLIGK